MKTEMLPCSKCKLPFVTFELIDGLCHKCTASELEKAKDDRNKEGMRVRAEFLPKLTALKAENGALRDTIAALKDFVDGKRNDNENIASLLNAVTKDDK